ncbi:MAG: serine/threonine-protein kinase, partial [Vicinamibacteria bacterium]
MTATEELPAVADPGLAMGRYRLGARLGAGGFGTVYAARDEQLGRPVAVKVVPADGVAPERAQREARAVARLDHEGIVALFDAGEQDGCRYLVSELVEGRTLAQLEADGTLSDRDVIRVGLALTDALAHAHDRGVVHRDVKPQNVIVPDEPGSRRGAAKLTDFGVAHLTGEEALTHTGDVVGTLAYMAPEQAAGLAAGEHADVYALGVVLYEALAGVHPVRAGTPTATARRIGTRLAPLARHRADLPPELCAAIDRAVLPDPGERGELDDLFDALAAALPLVSDEGGVIAPHPIERRRGVLLPLATRLAAPAATGALAYAALRGLTPEPAAAPLAVAGGAAVLTLI